MELEGGKAGKLIEGATDRDGVDGELVVANRKERCTWD